MWPFRKMRYRAVIVGNESGNRSPLEFMRWHTEEDAKRWCALANQHDKMRDPLTTWEYEEIE